ncbi:MAG: DNA recombination protein RmuC [Candidatus Poribacteria bacterium]|nr:DNA recombination protein RmuC [Candidatus Poribacteria bacterium]
MELLSLLIAFVIGGVVGGVIMSLRKSGNEALRIELAKLQSEKEAQADKEAWIEKAEEKLREAFDSLAGKSLRHNAEAFLKQAQTQMKGVLNEVRGDWKTQKSEIQNLMTPVKENLDKLDGHVRSLEEKREGAYQALGQQLKELMDMQHKLQTTTVTLSQALKSSSVRGQWGEIQLRRVVELAGMERYVAFEEQVSGDSGRPDMVVYLPGGGELPVDAKTPMKAYLEAAEVGDDAAYKDYMRAHAQAVRGRVRELGQKAYWSQFEKSPEVVVMFVPVEASVAAAFEEDPSLLEYALQSKVLITTPVTLLAFLKAVAYGWQQQAVSENARQIAAVGKELYQRITPFFGHLNTLRRRIDQTVESYNQSIGSLERRILPSVNRLQELDVGDGELDAPQTIDQRTRSLPEASE